MLEEFDAVVMVALVWVAWRQWRVVKETFGPTGDVMDVTTSRAAMPPSLWTL